MNSRTKFSLTVLILSLVVIVVAVSLPRPARAAGPWYLANHSIASRIAFGNMTFLNMLVTSSSSTIYVDASNNSGLEDGTQVHPFNTIQEGLGVASSGDTVQVAAGTYYEKLTLKNGVQLLGAGAEVTRIDGTGQNDSVVSASNVGPGTLLDGFTITHGTGKWIGSYTYGGGLYVSNSSLALKNCIVTENGASDGAGGIQVYVSTINIHNCTFSKNSGWWGGAMTIAGGTNAEIVDSIIDQSSAGYGGGILIAESSKVTLVNNLIMHTHAGVPAIGIDDTAGIGGSSSVTVTNNTIVDNLGNGIAWNKYRLGGSATIKNNILWGNNNDLVNLTATYSDIEDGDPGEGNISTYPLFVDPVNNDYHLRRISLCIDAGTNDGAPLTDFEGDPRPVDGNGDGIATVDMGADEFDPFVVTKGAVSEAAPGNPLTYKISLDNSGVISITDVLVTDTLPILVTYQSSSLTATNGDFGYANGVITWTGSLDPGENVAITYGTVVTQNVTFGTPLINSAVINRGGKVITRTATVYVGFYHISLPLVTRLYCTGPFYTDDFSNPASGWPIGNSASVQYGYLSGEYRLLVKNTNWGIRVSPGLKASDSIVSVDVRNATGVYGSYGLLFGLSDDFSQFYDFEIDPLGNYAIFQFGSGTYTLLAQGSSGSINTGTAANRIKIERNGAQIKAYANGQLLTSISDGSYTGLRRVGLIAFSYGQHNVDVRFDNFKAYDVACESIATSLNMTNQPTDIAALAMDGESGNGTMKPGAHLRLDTLPADMRQRQSEDQLRHQ